jgi:hypothetical protein
MKGRGNLGDVGAHTRVIMKRIIQEIGLGMCSLIYLAQWRLKRLAVVNTGVNLLVP